ncbi:MAG: nucleoside triphosphate pyrophosphohydrolase [Proteobacteria bacterium]|jgi:nucleoside triphosphate diphosphatase|nr:nucleoside triphosphate pyrophosphohydrolase [Pseudomonadota bacterium]MBT6192561.1 nucleoside triphosphate pyrophosphohydrolase [Pseudomonadota bacterium]MBT6465626.1 nucleoside triphosphate pyrophosphohydrolase [Pseudomonadota bacterium]MBT6674700.1 nucleoside triphosphate pyrophosphohydrolase [Pseudomonadota bacterium]MBT7246436.1 nucleoside triphosphate pyrophosphohydrolase [Pseudomonadota bacterium]
MSSLNELCKLVRQLREAETGSVWHTQQTHQSLAKYTIEEAYELADAIESGCLDHVPEEIGDLLFHVLLHCDIGDKQRQFDINLVIFKLKEKIKNRHPKVFDLNSPLNETKENWQELKNNERKGRGFLSKFDDIPISYPALLRADKIQNRASSFGFDWPDVNPVLRKVEEEFGELIEVIDQNHGERRAEEEFGDVLFTMVNLGRHLGIDSESALRKAVGKFERRIRAVENKLSERGVAIDQASAEELESVWELVKLSEPTTR